MVRRTKQEAEETRNRILDTAERLFVDKGVSRTSLADIASAAGVTRGAIYWHFENKADLFDAMMARVTLPMETMTAQAADGSLDEPLEFIRACALRVLDSLATDARTQRVFDIVCHKCEYVDEMAQVRTRHIKARALCLANIEQGLRNAVRKKRLPPGVEPRSAAIGMHALIDGLISNWVLDPGYFPLEREAARLIDSYLAGLGAQPAPRTARRVAPATGGTRRLPLAKTAARRPARARRGARNP